MRLIFALVVAFTCVGSESAFAAKPVFFGVVCSRTPDYVYPSLGYVTHPNSMKEAVAIYKINGAYMARTPDSRYNAGDNNPGEPYTDCEELRCENGGWFAEASSVEGPLIVDGDPARPTTLGMSCGHPSRKVAEAAAVNACKSQGGKNCKVSHSALNKDGLYRGPDGSYPPSVPNPANRYLNVMPQGFGVEHVNY